MELGCGVVEMEGQAGDEGWGDRLKRGTGLEDAPKNASVARAAQTWKTLSTLGSLAIDCHVKGDAMQAPGPVPAWKGGRVRLGRTIFHSPGFFEIRQADWGTMANDHLHIELFLFLERPLLSAASSS